MAPAPRVLESRPASQARIPSECNTANPESAQQLESQSGRKRRATTPEATAQQGSTPERAHYCISDSALSATTRPPAERAAASTTAGAAAVAVAVPYARRTTSTPPPRARAVTPTPERAGRLLTGVLVEKTIRPPRGQPHVEDGLTSSRRALSSLTVLDDSPPPKRDTRAAPERSLTTHGTNHPAAAGS
jgi:hypothetical protein